MTCIFLYLQLTSSAFQTFAVELTRYSLFIINQSVSAKFSAFFNSSGSLKIIHITICLIFKMQD